jgi:FkbM family methyltransferase
MNFIQKKLSGLKWRMKCLSYGMFFLRHEDFKIPGNLRVNGTKKKMNFIDVQNGGFKYEFIETCLNDGYHLNEIKKKLKDIKVIVDIGANQGLFAIAARKHFANASITCYEPNEQLESYLSPNASILNAEVYYEAVTKENCKVQLQFGETDLHTTTLHDDEGGVTGISFRNVIERAGGKIDVLKMDCEGGEWEILEDEESFKNVRSLSMEYHLWAKPGIKVEELFKRLEKLNFKVIFHNPLTETFGIITVIKKSELEK